MILAGHDRGARICHRLTVDFYSQSRLPHFSLRGTILLDIVPTLIQWSSFSSPANAVGTFHWPFLANAALSAPMIKAQGGEVFMRICLNRWLGKDQAKQAKFKEHDAMDVYAECFKQDSVVDASCDDYRAGGHEDIELQEEDQKEGRKLDGDVMVMYSEGYLGSRYNVREVWQEWMGKGNLETIGMGNGCGHFIPDECPEETTQAIVDFYNRHS
jgi:pimeloyl-ACP methyl ester carboxylesterase